jgi:hypothetical protein
MLEVRLLGKFEATQDKNLIRISSPLAQSLFAYLLLNTETAYRRERLAGLLWPDSLEETARENLRHALWRLRKAFLLVWQIICPLLSMPLRGHIKVSLSKGGDTLMIVNVSFSSPVRTCQTRSAWTFSGAGVYFSVLIAGSDTRVEMGIDPHASTFCIPRL